MRKGSGRSRLERDASARFRFAHDTGVATKVYLAQTNWRLGEVNLARQLADQAEQIAAELASAPTSALAQHFVTHLAVLRNDPAAALRSAEAVLA